MNYAANVTEALRKAEEESVRHKPFIISGRTLTYDILVDRIRKLTQLYKIAGLSCGDRVVIATHDDIEAAVLFLSLLWNGITAINIDPDTKPHRFSHIIRVSQPRGIILDAALKDVWKPDAVDFILEIKEDRPGKENLFNKLLRKKQVKKNEDHFYSYPASLRTLEATNSTAVIDQDLDAYILFTSGTTSDPKGVRISHKNLFSHLHTLSRQFGYTRDSRILNILMLSHADGIIQGPVIAFFNQASLYRPMRFEIKTIGALLDSIRTHRITHFVTVPTVLSLIERFCKDKRNTLITGDFQTIISTGAYLEAGLWKRIEEYFQVRIANVYGLTETVTGGLFSGPGENDHYVGTVGKPADCEVRIVDEQGTDVRTGEPGELLMKGNHVMKGYLDAPEATAGVLRDGWLFTGDIATVDEKGFYRIVGRKKNIIISGGINIHPEEITEVLNLSPHVTDAVTFGVPDEVWGERVVSAVSLTDQCHLSEKDLISFCRTYLEETKVPDKIYVLPSLPKGPIGKVLIGKVKQIIQQIDSNQNTDLQGNLETRIISIAAHCFNVNQSDLLIYHGPDDTTGWDSLTHLEFVAALESHFGITFSPSEIMQIGLLSDALRIIAEKLSSGERKKYLP